MAKGKSSKKDKYAKQAIRTAKNKEKARKKHQELHERKQAKLKALGVK